MNWSNYTVNMHHTTTTTVSNVNYSSYTVTYNSIGNGLGYLSKKRGPETNEDAVQLLKTHDFY